MKSKLLVENWRSFLNENQEGSIKGQYDIGLVPMSAKPFHEGHMSLVRKAADECKEAIIYVSTSDRKRKGEITIFGEDMRLIWETILTKYLPQNTRCEYGGSPIRKVYEKLEEGVLPENISSTYAIYTGEEDAGRYYAIKTQRLKGSELTPDQAAKEKSQQEAIRDHVSNLSDGIVKTHVLKALTEITDIIINASPKEGEFRLYNGRQVRRAVAETEILEYVKSLFFLFQSQSNFLQFLFLLSLVDHHNLLLP